MPGKFKTDVYALRSWLDTRRKSLEDARRPHERKWKQIREVFCPNLGLSLKGDADGNHLSGERDDAKIFNTTPSILLCKLAAGLQSGITNQSRQWFVFKAKSDEAAKFGSVRAYLGKATDFLHAKIAASNIYTALDQMYLRLSAFGQSAALLVPDEETVVRLVVSDEGAYWIDEDRRGRVDTLLRRLRFSVGALASEFGLEALPDSIRDAFSRGETSVEHTVWHLVFPAKALPDGLHVRDIPAGRPFVSVYWLDASGAESSGIVAIRSFDFNPIVAPRWSINGLTVYGYGPGEIGLGDAKELQAIELSSLRLTELESNPPMAAPSTMKGIPLDTGPGGITYYDPIAQSGNFMPVQRLFETRQSIEAVEIKINAVSQRLAQIFYTDLFAMLLNLEMRGRQRTATEVQELSREKVSLLGPILTRLNGDLLRPLVEGAWHLCYARAQRDAQTLGRDTSGILDAPEALVAMGGEIDEDGSVDAIDIEYTSTLHAEQLSTSRLAGPFRFVEFFGGIQSVLQSPELGDNIDADELLREAAEVLDSSGFIRDKKDVETIREGRARAAAEAQMAAQARQMPTQAQSVAELADGRLTPGATALDIIAGAQGVV